MTPANLGGAYRLDEAVDVSATSDVGGGYNVGWTEQGEWLAYSVSISQAGSYTLSVRLSHPGPGGTFHVEVDGEDVTGPIQVPDTGGWSSWQTISVSNVGLPSGTRTVYFVLDGVSSITGALANVNFFSFQNNALEATSCPAANPNDFVSDDTALNACLNAGGGVTLVPGSPGYIVETGLVIGVHNVVFQGYPGTKPLVNAHPNLAAPMLTVNIGTVGYIIRDLAFFGNRNGRTAGLDIASPPHFCAGGYTDRVKGYNLQLRGSDYTVEGVDSEYALCGSGMELDGARFTARNNRVRHNGFNYSQYGGIAVADGITAYCEHGFVVVNEVTDNTDVNLVVGPGRGCRVAGNVISQIAQLGQVGLMVGFGGDHAGSLMDHNLVQSGLDLMWMGLLVGHHAYDTPPNFTETIDAGRVEFNNIQGAAVLAAIDGVTTGTFLNNAGGNRQGDFPFPNCAQGIAFTAGDFGQMQIQPGFVPRTYHRGPSGVPECQPQ